MNEEKNMAIGRKISELIRTIKVIKIIDDSTVVINKGLADGIRMDQRFLFYKLGEDIIDPETKENLGKYEIVKGTGCVVNLEENKSTVCSDKVSQRSIARRRIKKPPEYFIGFSNTEIEEIETEKINLPFHNIEEKDRAKLI
jgi:hypothetical protein